MPFRKIIPVAITQETLRDGLNVLEKKYPISLASAGIRNSEREACNLVIIPTCSITTFLSMNFYTLICDLVHVAVDCAHIPYSFE